MKNFIDSLSTKLSGFVSSLKTDKKKLFIVIGIVVIILLIIIFGGKKKEVETPGFGTQLGNIINSENYNGSGTLAICNNEFNITMNQNQKNLQIGIKNDAIDYSGLITKFNDAIYLNSGTFESKGDILSIRKTTPKAEKGEEIPAEVTIKDILIDVLNSEYLTYSETENEYTTSITNGENWSKFFNEASVKLSDKKEDILKYYTDVSPVKAEIDNICSILKNIAASTNDANSITLVISYNPESEEYTLSIDVSLDFASLPSFIQEKDFDTNKFTLYSTLNYTFTDNTVNIPSGSVRNIGNENINTFVVNCWNSLFERKTYTTRSIVTEKVDSVQNVINLGNTTETYQYLFDKDGVCQGTLLVKSTDEKIIKQYIDEFSPNVECKTVFNANTKEFSTTIDITETGISSLNKIATTPHGLAAYLKTAEGVVPIV